MTLSINTTRLQQDIETLSAIGRREDHGLYRMAFTEGDMEGRAWFKQQLEEAGLEVYEDGAANIHGRLNWDDETPAVVTGSHLDTVPAAGHLDGALGVLVGLECLRCIKEQNLPLRHPLEVISFTDEEGRFGGMAGSQAIAGQLTPESIHQAVDLDGVTLSEAMQQNGYDAMHALHARYRPEAIHAFVELHIEQGPILDQMGLSVGVVDAIAGLFKWEVSLIGTANHAGTTPMHMRNDAFQGLAEFSSEIQRILEENGSARSVATIGRVDIKPGAPNVVPGRVEFSLEARDTDAHTLEDLQHAFRKALSAIARRRNLMFEFKILSEIDPVKCDLGLVNDLEEVAKQLKHEPLIMASGAAHDTQMMARIARAAMVFVPSKGGRSHSSAEWTELVDIERGANVMLNALYKIAGEQQV
ncbi:Zn-dependent hydrolase [Thiohalophilus thiocyanatoxydans]|uniref:N-carbamoyl-L-amino-acid hydrolase n=1 Tax=Thiohalophilus thiocyanatoxydans TaxID=381308 RepID=A0A4R8IHH7_9GAMM|nr:Zn-dependent hydrolase [Thiohalophilus thiocyanatoxydans]TDX99677.1 N-carbamoyl-L-amino-acid hydrolase [Thiohalophilus thiocyanatoxydans]